MVLHAASRELELRVVVELAVQPRIHAFRILGHPDLLTVEQSLGQSSAERACKVSTGLSWVCEGCPLWCDATALPRFGCSDVLVLLI